MSISTQGSIFLAPIRALYLFIILLFACVVSGCSTTAITQPATLQLHPNAVTVPYRLSPAGRIVLDVAVNENAPQPFILDTGANVSVIYDDVSDEMELYPTGETVLVRGLVSVGRRPIIESVNIRIGTAEFPPSRIAILEKPYAADGVVGLLGADALSDYVVLFHKETMTATFLPSAAMDEASFAGWRRIALKNQTKGRSDIGLHFAETLVVRTMVPVLIDTGSNSNFINWRFAVLNNNIRRFERNLRKQGKLQGALSATNVKMDTVLSGLEIGQRYWPEIDVTVIELDPLSTIAPVDKPMMIAGAGMFTPWTFAFDFGRDKIYFYPAVGDVRPPEIDWGYSPP